MAQENAFKEGAVVGLNQHRGNGGRMVANVAVITELERLDARIEAAMDKNATRTAHLDEVLAAAARSAKLQHQRSIRQLDVALDMVLTTARPSCALRETRPPHAGVGDDRGSAAATRDLEGDAPRGAGLYAKHCAACHGKSGEGEKGPALGNPALIAVAGAGFFTGTIVRGRPGTKMPSFGTGGPEHPRLPAAEVADLVAFLRAGAASRALPAR